MTLGTPATALVEPAGATRPLGVFTRGARALLLGGALASCAGSGTRNAADAAAPVDLGVVNDLSPPPDQGHADASADDALGVLDASADLPGELGADASVDRRDASSPWGDAPFVDLGGFLIPVDPNAVPAPGSECTGDAGVRAGDPTIAAPRPIRPLSVSRVTSQRPTFQWVLPAGTTGARVEVCADRCCTRVLQTFDAEGTTVRPTTALPPGVVFWRMFGRRGTAVGSRASYTWEFGVRRRDAPNDTSWGTIRDFNGDGYDDLVVVSAATSDATRSNVLLLTGSDRGITAPVMTDIMTQSLPNYGSVGDFNGDGIADVVWGDGTPGTGDPGWVDVVMGSRSGLRRSGRLDTREVGGCALVALPQAVDWNGDGYSDVVVSVELRCDIFVPPIATFLLGYSGSFTGVADVPQWVLRVDDLFLHRATYARGALGDIDLDGYGDLYLVSRFTGAGTAPVRAEHHIAHGTAGGLPRYERVTDPSVNEPGVVSPVGDVDGDGHVDTTLLLDGQFELRVYRHASGWSAPSEILADVSLAGGAGFGGSVSVGDVNGDGLSDVIVSCSGATDEVDEASFFNRGRVYVYAGTRGGLSTVGPSWVERAHAAGDVLRRDYFGGPMISPGDVDGDGLDDIVMGDTLENRFCVRSGRVALARSTPDVCFPRLWPSYATYL